jgi:hypothetical protein
MIKGRTLFVALSICLLFMASCSQKSGVFRIQGSFKGMNQGELYIYGTYGSHKLDTISLQKGEFEYRIPLEDTLTFVLVFPNFSELPVFAMPGATITIEGDATHLKETQIKGTAENKEMTAFRLQTSQMTPPEVIKVASDFIKENPTSPLSRYILDRYFIRTPEADYQLAHEMTEVLRLANPEDEGLAELSRQVEGLKINQKGLKIPTFSAKDVNGNSVSSSDLNGKVNIITLWATYNYESMSIQNLLNRLKSKYGDDLKIISVCLDANLKECQRIIGRDSIKWSTVCDGQMWETPILQKTGLTYLPDNIVADAQGKIIARRLNYQKMTDKLKELLE